MKLILSIMLLAIGFALKGQPLEIDSLRKTLRSDAKWAITHKDYLKGKEILGKLIIEEPSNSENYFIKAMIYYYQKKSDSLTICLNKALELGRDSMRVFREFFRFYSFQQDDNSKCIYYINKMIILQPNNCELYMERRSLRIDIDDYTGFWKDTEIAARLGNVTAKEQLESREKDTKRLKEKGIIK